MTIQVQGESAWELTGRTTRWPFTDSATYRDATGVLEIPLAAVEDARLWAPLDTVARVFLKELVLADGTLTLTFATTAKDVASATATDPRQQRVALYSPVGDTAGYVRFGVGGLAAVMDNPTGTYRFSSTAMELVPAAVTPLTAPGLRSIRDAKGAVAQELRIVGGEGVRLVASPSGIRVDAVGDPFYRRDTCEDADVMSRSINPVRRIYWQDVRKGRSGIVRPKNGRIVTTVRALAGTRGFAVPGENGTLVSVIGG